MAIQFPNFLSVPVRTPDYSGLSNIVDNYYAGKAMPKDDLMKAIQAEFARPNAEQSLLSSKLTNRKSQLDIEKTVREVAEQKVFEQQLRQALGGGAAGAANGGGGGGASGAMPSMNGANGASQPAMPMGMPTAPNPVLLNPNLSQALSQSGGQQSMPTGASTDLQSDGIDPTKMEPRYRKFDQMATGLPNSAYQGGSAGQPAMGASQPAAAPIVAQEPAEPALNEITVSKGSPHLAGVDMMWENNPRSRAFLEKQGYKKTQELKFDNKTGRTTILTKYPSGRITVQTSGGVGGTGEAPLTTKMVSKHQNIISSIDNAEPIIQKILDEKGFQPYPRGMGMGMVPGWMSQSTKYDALVKSALDSLIGAYGLPMTNEGINTVKDQLLIGHGETTGAYRKRLKELIKDLDRRKAYSAGEVKKTLKNPPVSSGYDQTDPYGLSNYDTGSGDNASSDMGGES